jgi:hypothetical protein
MIRDGRGQRAMPARFVSIDRDTPLLLAPNLSDWVPDNHLRHFILDAVAELDLRQAEGKKLTGRGPQPPKSQPGARDQYNFTDPESRIMKAGNGEHFEQAYNAQAAVEVESRLIVGQRVSDAGNDKEQLVPTVAAIPDGVGAVEAVLIDSGFYSEAAVKEVEA